MTEIEIGRAVFASLLLFLVVGAVEVLVAINKEQIRSWWAWRKRRPDITRYTDATQFRNDLTIWKINR